MAPLDTRQSHSLVPGIPRLPKRPPNTLTKVHKSIKPTVLTELFVGTVGIFIIAVLFWKLGGFIRRFNRNKVLRAGKNANTRYARTWYGWVSRSTHERNKRAIHDFFSRIWNSMTWKTTRDDYTWIWWDPGDVERQKHNREQKRFRWIPDCLQSYDDFPTADEIWNPCLRPKCHGALKDSVSIPQPVPAPGSVRQPQAQEAIGSVVQREPTLVNNKPDITRSILEEILRDPFQPNDGSSDHQLWFNSRENAASLATRVPTPLHQVQSLPCRQSQSYQIRGSIPWSHGNGSQAISRQIQSAVQHEGVRYELAEPSSPTLTKEPIPLHRHGDHRRYRGWSARMQMGPKDAVFDNIGDSSGPPGTPRTELLVSYVSDPSCSLRGRFKRQRNSTEGRLRISEDRTSFTSRVLIGNQVLFSNEQCTYTKTIQWNSAPARSHFRGKGTTSKARPALSDEWRFMCEPKHFAHSRRKGKRPEIDVIRCSPDQIQLKTGCAVDDLSDWEVRMMERLDRKLSWLFNEFTPGQKPYHFALLANHWLNRETWIVYDPISRVPADARRVWGDPRFNVPYPQPDFSPRPKYPASKRKRAQTPRIDSWRAAVNKRRKISGIRDAIRTITLYEESAEEPPDGHIDPGCWALPRPPQGFEMSTAQKNAWYEGGAGWQEKLDDWQQVHWGYRLHKAIHEGRVNRGRVKEVAAQVNKCCRTASGKLISGYDLGKRAPNFLVS
ncbi:uncharacterized protein N7479_008026 [Penicillium vulpinum]|uniref:Uncharacterized protein n=1 Tax=Penicillium vulpinum TaxID=29845 RepID=A0A1V6RLH4_9EURO|nr:uncharacterized protein N7479_008026 [Penicillium vulpinum]KAJ5960876.1 hypothetical protein N7479_008026 [Penicillium vulpinum]OQE02692.1 hypothetical protein PENVUL_c039G07970 [Penicillium vulpinum]